MKAALVCGAGGFIGGHLVKRLEAEWCWVRGVDIILQEYCPSLADDFIVGDLLEKKVCRKVTEGKQFNELYQQATDMGGSGYVFFREHDAAIMHNSATINLNIVEEAKSIGIDKVFFSSSACVYPDETQMNPDNLGLPESVAYPPCPDSEYGREKPFSERLYLSYHRNYGLKVHIARLHNIFGPEGTWNGGKKIAPAAMCRKVAIAPNGGEIKMWGDGEQTRTFLYIDDAWWVCAG